MRRWGLLVSAVYFLLLYLLFLPLWSGLGGDDIVWVVPLADLDWDWDWGSFEFLFGIGLLIVPILGLLLSQAVLFVSVDRSFRRPLPPVARFSISTIADRSSMRSFLT